MFFVSDALQVLDFDVSVCSFFFFGSNHVLDEAKRSLHDALCVLSQTVNDSRVLLGGGWPEMVNWSWQRQWMKKKENGQLLASA